jgi:hypothetical protein
MLIPAVITAAQVYARTNPVVVVGSAFYLAYQAYGLIVNPDGSVSTPYNVGSQLGPNTVVPCPAFSSIAYCSAAQLPNPCPSGYTAQGSNGMTGTPQQLYQGNYYSCVIYTFNFNPPSPVPSLPSDTDQALYNYMHTGDISVDAANAVKALQAMPSTSYTPPAAGSPASTLVTPWGEFSRVYDAAGNQVIVQKQDSITVSPGPTISDPMPTKVTENTKTLTNGVQTGSSSQNVATAATGTTADAAALAPAVDPNAANNPASSPPATQTDCDLHPEHVGCLTSTNDLTLDTPLTQSINVAITPWAMGGSGACPAPVKLAFTTWEWTPYCNFANGARPIVLAFAWLGAAYILIGVRQDA